MGSSVERNTSVAPSAIFKLIWFHAMVQVVFFDKSIMIHKCQPQSMS